MTSTKKGTKLGSIILYEEKAPPYPPTLEQARLVASFLFDIISRDPHPMDQSAQKKVLGSLKKFSDGDLSSRYKQHTKEEIEAEKTRMSAQTSNGGISIWYDEDIMERLLLPIEMQLSLDFLNARGQVWPIEHGTQLSWEAWDEFRLRIEVSQSKLPLERLQNATRLKGGAGDIADALISEGLDNLHANTLEAKALKSAVRTALFREYRITHPIHSPYPIQLPERVPKWAWTDGIQLTAYGWWGIDEGVEKPAHLQNKFLAIPSAKPMLMADRALRSYRVWNVSETIPEYKEARTPGISLQYYSENLQPEQLLNTLKRLDTRTSDVWRLILAKALEEGGGQVYTPIKLDLRELARALGYKPHKNGGMKPEHLREVGEALEHIERLQILITPEAKTLELDKQQKSRKFQSLKNVRQERILAIMAKTGQRDLFGDTHFIEWEVALGPWARYFDRSFAPIFRSLVQLSARGSTNVWAKQLGTELAYYYRQDKMEDPDMPSIRRRRKRLHVQTLLERACLMPEFEDMRASRNHRRAKKYFEDAMDLLQTHDVHAGWAYDPEDHDKFMQMDGKPGGIDLWLRANVIIEAPEAILQALPAPAKRTFKS